MNCEHGVPEDVLCLRCVREAEGKGKIVYVCERCGGTQKSDKPSGGQDEFRTPSIGSLIAIRDLLLSQRREGDTSPVAVLRRLIDNQSTPRDSG